MNALRFAMMWVGSFGDLQTLMDAKGKAVASPIVQRLNGLSDRSQLLPFCEQCGHQGFGTLLEQASAARSVYWDLVQVRVTDAMRQHRVGPLDNPKSFYTIAEQFCRDLEKPELEESCKVQ